MTLNKDVASLTLEDSGFDMKLGFDKDMMTFKNNGTDTLIFPLKSKVTLRALDQIILTGHYLYGKNEEFRLAYINAFGKEFSINYKDMRELFTRNLFAILLYGTVTSVYVKNMPAIPPHYLHRPKVDERNDSIVNFINNEKAAGRKTFRTEGVPYYSYMLKKSVILNTNTTTPTMDLDKPIFGVSNNRFNNQVMAICPIKELVEPMKSAIVGIEALADNVYKLLMESGVPEYRYFAQLFTDKSWSPYINMSARMED